MLPLPKLPKIDTDNLDFSKVRKDVAEKRVHPVLEHYKHSKRQERIKWFRDNWISLFAAFIALAAFIKSFF